MSRRRVQHLFRGERTMCGETRYAHSTKSWWRTCQRCVRIRNGQNFEPKPPPPEEKTFTIEEIALPKDYRW